MSVALTKDEDGFITPGRCIYPHNTRVLTQNLPIAPAETKADAPEAEASTSSAGPSQFIYL